MNALLLILLLQPQMPPPQATLNIAVPTMRLGCFWSNWPTVGVSNILYYGRTPAMENMHYVGATNFVPVTVEVGADYWFKVQPIFRGVPGTPLLAKIPPKVLRHVTVKWPDGEQQVLRTYTNTPPSGMALIKLSWREEEDYSP